MNKRYMTLALLIVVSLITSLGAEVKVKVKDIVYIDGLKENQVLGYGLVVGLQGTGDTKLVVAQESLKNLLKNLGLEEKDAVKSKNVAAVVVTAQLPPFVRIGDRIDVTVSSIGDAKSLEGGLLVQSALKGADDQIYVVAQGPLAAVQQSRRAGRSVKTVFTAIRAGMVERAIDAQYVTNNTISLVLREWDFSVADEIIKAVADKYPNANPELDQNGKMRLTVPTDIKLPEFIAGVQDIEVTPDSRARVVVNEKDGTIVTGGNVKLSEAMISKEGITIKVEGETKSASAVYLKDAPSVKDLVDTLNAVGLPTSDIISILKALKDSGSLHAELIIK
ncbi:MAG TPA: flagellar basal body P-ring protein FlgI [Spirochaetota bacterium]